MLLAIFSSHTGLRGQDVATSCDDVPRALFSWRPRAPGPPKGCCRCRALSLLTKRPCLELAQGGLAFRLVPFYRHVQFRPFFCKYQYPATEKWNTRFGLALHSMECIVQKKSVYTKRPTSSSYRVCDHTPLPSLAHRMSSVPAEEARSQAHAYCPAGRPPPTSLLSLKPGPLRAWYYTCATQKWNTVVPLGPQNSWRPLVNRESYMYTCMQASIQSREY